MHDEKKEQALFLGLVARTTCHLLCEKPRLADGTKPKARGCILQQMHRHTDLFPNPLSDLGEQNRTVEDSLDY